MLQKILSCLIISAMLSASHDTGNARYAHLKPTVFVPYTGRAHRAAVAVDKARRNIKNGRAFSALKPHQVNRVGATGALKRSASGQFASYPVTQDFVLHQQLYASSMPKLSAQQENLIREYFAIIEANCPHNPKFN